MDLNYSAIRPLDAVCTASSSFIGRMIRLRTAPLVKLNSFKEFGRLQMANHVGLVVEHSDRLWIAEMLGTGLEINSLRDYVKNTDKDRIVSIRRLHLFENESVRESANELLIQWAHKTIPYDWYGIVEFLGLRKDNPNWMYCSELAEIVANRYGATWDKWQLQRNGKKSRIAPCEIQYGRTGRDVEGWAA